MLVRVGLILSVCVSLTIAAGCGGGSTEGPSKPADAKQTSAVTGSVTIDGQAPNGLSIYLVPASSTTVGLIDEDFSSGHVANPDTTGNFTFTTYVYGDGAPAGDYVAVMRWAPRGQQKPSDSGVERFNNKDGDFAASKFKVKVEADKPTVLEKWELKSK